jgi:hypothetical protein
MSDDREAGFELRFDGGYSHNYPHGYWYAATNDGSWDADGATPLDALANLVTLLHKGLLDHEEEVK